MIKRSGELRSTGGWLKGTRRPSRVPTDKAI